MLRPTQINISLFTQHLFLCKILAKPLTYHLYHLLLLKTVTYSLKIKIKHTAITLPQSKFEKRQGFLLHIFFEPNDINNPLHVVLDIGVNPRYRCSLAVWRALSHYAEDNMLTSGLIFVSERTAAVTLRGK